MKQQKIQQHFLRIPFETLVVWLLSLILCNYSSHPASFSFVANALQTPEDEAEASLITVDRLSRFIDSGTSYLSRVCHTIEQDPDQIGKFTYTAFLDEDLRTDFVSEGQNDYNLLRHSGAIYSMILSYNRSPSEDILEVLQRAVRWLKAEAIGPVPDMSSSKIHAQNDDESDGDTEVDQIVPKGGKSIPNLLAAWESGAMKGGGSALKPTAKLGGAGLALVALVGLEQITPGSTPLEEMRKIGKFIEYMQKDDGSFTCRYKPHKGGKDDSWVSLFYPGEASLGLMYLANFEDEDSPHRKRWIRVATKALLYLERYRRNLDLNHVEPDHWALIATSKLLPLLDSSSSDYWRVYQHAIKVITSIVDQPTKKVLVEKYHGCHTSNGDTCSTSTQLEGLLASMTFVKDSEMFLEEDEAEPLKDRMMFWIRHGADFILNSMQYEDNDHHNMVGGVPKIFPPRKGDDKEVRIDYVQHSMSAMIAYERMLNREGPYAPKGKIQRVASAAKRNLKKVASRVSRDSIEEQPLNWVLSIVVVIAVMVVAASSMMKTAPKSKKQI